MDDKLSQRRIPIMIRMALNGIRISSRTVAALREI